MKNNFYWLFVFALLFSSICASRAMPAAGMDYMCALMNYNLGVKQTQSNPQAAIKSFLKADQWIQRARLDGAGYQVNQLSQLIGRALMLTEIKQKTNPVANRATQNNSRPNNVKPLKRNIGAPAIAKTKTF